MYKEVEKFSNGSIKIQLIIIVERLGSVDMELLCICPIKAL
jgi:hypothetical protein